MRRARQFIASRADQVRSGSPLTLFSSAFYSNSLYACSRWRLPPLPAEATRGRRGRKWLHAFFRGNRRPHPIHRQSM